MTYIETHWAVHVFFIMGWRLCVGELILDEVISCLTHLYWPPLPVAILFANKLKANFILRMSKYNLSVRSQSVDIKSYSI